MTEEEKKTKYKDIVYRLRVINNKLEDLDNSISSLKETNKRSITIDDTCIGEEYFKEINNDIKSVLSSINQDIIPSLNNRMYD